MSTAADEVEASGPVEESGRSRARGARRGVAQDVLLALGAFLVLGLLGAVLWSQLVTPADYTKVSGGGGMGETDFGHQFSADGWFVVIGVLGGLLAGLVLTGWRRRDPLLVVGLLVVGSCLAAAVVAVLGHLLGPGDPGAALRAVGSGAKVPERLDVGPQLPGQPHESAFPVYLSWPVGALVGAMFVLLSRGPSRDIRDADRDEPHDSDDFGA
jgi:hypothetical protein